jgi:hypothetical protein
MSVDCRRAQRGNANGDEQQVNDQLHLVRSSRMGMRRLASSLACLDFDPFTTAKSVAGEMFVYSMCFCEICDCNVTVIG